MSKDKKIVGTFGPQDVPMMVVLIEHPVTKELHQLMPDEDQYVDLVRAVVGVFEDGLLPMLPHPIGEREWTGPTEFKSNIPKPSPN